MSVIESYAFASQAALFHSAVGHIVDAPGRYFVDDHATDLEGLEGAPGVIQIIGEDACLQPEAAGVDLGEGVLDIAEGEGHDERRESDRVEALGRGLHLTENDVEGLASFPLLEAFAHAEDWDELVNQERAHLLAHAGVRFAEDLTALGMPDDAMRATGIEK